MGHKKMTAAGTVGVHVTESLRELIDARGEAISFTRSKYIASILEWWRLQGAPPVTQADEAMQQIKALRVAEPPGKYGKK